MKKVMLYMVLVMGCMAIAPAFSRGGGHGGGRHGGGHRGGHGSAQHHGGHGGHQGGHGYHGGGYGYHGGYGYGPGWGYGAAALGTGLVVGGVAGAAMAGSGETTVVEEPTTVVETAPADYSSEDNGSEADE